MYHGIDIYSCIIVHIHILEIDIRALIFQRSCEFGTTMRVNSPKSLVNLFRKFGWIWFEKSLMICRFKDGVVDLSFHTVNSAYFQT